MNRSQRTMGAVTVVVAAVAAQMLSALQALGGDDIYVLANLHSASWSRRLFAFDLDMPAPGYMPWWTGMGFQRRFIRVPASALLWLESELFGFRSFPYHLVTIALLACSCLLLFILFSRRAPVATAAAVSVLPAIHPAASEIVADLCCQPIATAGLFSVASVAAWWRMRERPSRAALAVVVLSCVLAVTSYEAAVVLPIFLALADRVTEATQQILARVPGDSTVVAVGTYLCGFAPSLVWSGPTLLGIPSRFEDDPQLRRVDDHTLIARSEVGFDVRTQASVPRREPGVGRGPAWAAAQPAELAVRGSQRIAGATVSIELRDGERIAALRYLFDRPLSEVVFIRFRGCAEPEPMVLEPAP